MTPRCLSDLDVLLLESQQWHKPTSRTLQLFSQQLAKTRAGIADEMTTITHAEAAAWQDGHFVRHAAQDRVRTSTDDIDAPMLHTLSYCVACGSLRRDHEARQGEAQP